jgi:imidazoleglycerol-phosphate dehydratase
MYQTTNKVFVPNVKNISRQSLSSSCCCFLVDSLLFPKLGTSTTFCCKKPPIQLVKAPHCCIPTSWNQTTTDDDDNHTNSNKTWTNTRREAQVTRKTAETEVFAHVVLDGQGKAGINTGIPFLDHMLCQICSHGLLDLSIQATGDLHIDDHHTNEDVGITLGLALSKALGDKRGIQRFGHFIAPLDEALVQVVLDFSGRPFLHYGLDIPTQRVGTFDTQLVREFYSAVATNGQFTLHIRQLEGINSHHIIEASFKAFARALRMAIEYDARRMGSIPSSKGSLSQDTQVVHKD